MNFALLPAILVIGLLTFAIRVSFLALVGKIGLTREVERTLGLVPVAVLVAIIVPAVAGAPPAGSAIPRLVAAVVAAIVAWRTRRPLVTIVVGMAIVLVGEQLPF